MTKGLAESRCSRMTHFDRVVDVAGAAVVVVVVVVATNSAASADADPVVFSVAAVASHDDIADDND